MDGNTEDTMREEPEGRGISLPQDEEPEGRGSSLAQEDGVLEDDILEYDIRLPDEEDHLLEYDTSRPDVSDPVEYDMTLASTGEHKGYERKAPPTPLSPVLKELYQPPGFFRSHRKLNI